MHVVVAEILPGATEVAAAAARGRDADQHQHQDRRSGPDPGSRPDRKMRLRHVDVPISAPPAAAAGSSALFRPPAVAGLIRLAFDSDHRKDQDNPHALAWSAIHSRAPPPRRRKFNDGAHVKLISACRAGAIWLAACRH
jgi:hypothetical protein